MMAITQRAALKALIARSDEGMMAIARSKTNLSEIVSTVMLRWMQRRTGSLLLRRYKRRAKQFAVVAPAAVRVYQAYTGPVPVDYGPRSGVTGIFQPG